MLLGLTQNLMTPRAVQGFVGPLDVYASSIVRCWCPGKRLLSSWSGGAGVLRETTGNSEQTFGFTGPGQYLNTANVNSFLTAAGASAAAWKTAFDQKGSGDDLTQLTAASQPLYIGNHAGFNNRACVHLSSISMGMASALDILLPYSIVVVEDDDGTPSSLRTISSYSGTNIFVNNLICANRTSLSFYRGGTVSTTATSAPCVEILTAPSSGNHVAWQNGANVTTASQVAGDWRKLAIGVGPGGSEGAITKIFAVLVFNISLSASDVSALQNLLAPATL